MLIESGVIALGMAICYFLKDIQFLSLNFSFMNTGIINPDFLLMFVIFFALFRGELTGLWVGFFAGLLEDSANWVVGQSSAEFTPLIGIHSLIYALSGFFLGKINRVIDRRRTLPIIVLVLISTFVVRILTWLLQGIVDDFNKNYSLFGPALYTAFIAPLWFTLMGWIYRIRETGEE
ncbi:MAG: rod shape-determining protein MreD [Leptospirales bacterium]|nr:rod shape-determining protein MreD [Leptospirales bacterium]